MKKRNLTCRGGVLHDWCINRRPKSKIYHSALHPVALYGVTFWPTIEDTEWRLAVIGWKTNRSIEQRWRLIELTVIWKPQATLCSLLFTNVGIILEVCGPSVRNLSDISKKPIFFCKKLVRLTLYYHSFHQVWMTCWVLRTSYSRNTSWSFMIVDIYSGSFSLSINKRKGFLS